MMVLLKKILTYTLGCGFAVAVVIVDSWLSTGLVINEVLSNEPGDSTTLEWIELFNSTATPVSTQLYRLRIGSKWVPLPTLDPPLAPGEYFIVCRRLLAGRSAVGRNPL